MAFKDSYPEYVAIEDHIRRARVERSLAIAQMIADMAEITIKGLRKFGRAMLALKRGAHVPEWARHPSPHR